MYRTGDLARWLGRGSVAYLGRADRQLKVRGQRLEPGEIEVVLCRHQGVLGAAVVARADPPGDPTLIAYVTTADGRPAPDAELVAHLRHHLPAAMIPATFVHLAALPLTPNGKVDHAALPAPSPATAAAGAPPRSPFDTSLEQLVADVLSEPLPGRRIGPRRRLRRSRRPLLLAARAVYDLALATGCELPLTTFLEGATVRRLAALVLAGLALPRAGEAEAVCVQLGAPDVTPFFMPHGDLAGGGIYCRALVSAPPPGAAVTRCRRSARRVAGDAHHRGHGRAPPGRGPGACSRAGPGRLGGFCVGGLVAYAMAVELRRAGEAVELLLLVDSYARNLRGSGAAALARALIGVTTRDPYRRVARAAVLPYLEALRGSSRRARAPGRGAARALPWPRHRRGPGAGTEPRGPAARPRAGLRAAALRRSPRPALGPRSAGRRGRAVGAPGRRAGALGRAHRPQRHRAARPRARSPRRSAASTGSRRPAPRPMR
ncbi:MAG: thioesterase domain-containing protein [Myxococcota bacterium]